MVICTLDRPESLNETLLSLCRQSRKDFEIILIPEKGDLSVLRDKGLRCARGRVVSFIDDDVYCPPNWYEGVLKGFREGVVGVSGPTIITQEFRGNRDLFKYRFWKKAYDAVFLGRRACLPGQLGSGGTPSTASNDEDCHYHGDVNYLEACNMSVIREVALNAGGFDHHYQRTGEWCEVDLALKIRQNGRLFFSRSAYLYHRPSRAGAYAGRLTNVDHRFKNFRRYQSRWFRPGPRFFAYRAFVWAYFKLKGRGLV